MTIRFKFAALKALTAIHWMVREHTNLDLHASLKACYFADKTHLNEYHIPIFGATYKAMKFGPVPLEIYEMIKGEALWKAELSIESFPWELSGYLIRNIGNYEPNLENLSSNNFRHLSEGLKRSVSMHFNERTEATHGIDWQRANLGTIRYEDMIDEKPNKAEIIANLEANSRYMRL